MKTALVWLILAIAGEVGVPPYFALSIAKEENWTLNESINIHEEIKRIKEQIDHPQATTYWIAAIFYDAGTQWLDMGVRPPDSSIEYADRIIARWNELTDGYAETLIRGKRF